MAESNVRSLKDLLDKDKQWLIDYMSNNPGADVIDNYIFAVNTLKEGFKCASGNKCDLLQRDCKDRDSEESRLFLLCFSCDRIFHQRCSKASEEDLVNEKTPWICFECTSDPLNKYATEFFKSGRQNLTLKERLERYTTAADLPSPRQKTQEASRDYLDSFFDMSVIEQSLHVDFKNLEPIDISKILGTKLLQQKNEFEALREVFLQSEREKKELNEKLAQKAAENEARDLKMQQLEKTINERLYLQDSKLQSLPIMSTASGVRQTPPPLSSTMVMNHISHQNGTNASGREEVQPSSSALRQSHAENAATKAALLNQASYSVKVLSANDVIAQIAQELNQVPAQHQNISNPSHTINSSVNSASYHLPVAENQDYSLSLKDIRKSLPKIEKYDGNIDKWLTFERAVERNIREGRFCDSLAKNLIRQALSGQPLERVDSIYNFSSASEIMNYLKESYGCSTNIVASARKKLLAIKLARPLTHFSVMEVTTKITSYMAACKYAQLPILDMSISMHIHSQLDSTHQQEYYKYFYQKFPGSTRLERLDVQFEFLNELSKTLPMNDNKSHEKKESSGKNFQVYSTSVASSKSGTNSRSSFSKFQSKGSKGSNDDFKYEIRSKEAAPYIGYDMDKVQALKKKCDICNKLSHFSLECQDYRDMPMDQRYYMVKTKGICSNCLLTTEHQPRDCNLKLGCGFNINNNSKCSQKHHITLHRGNYIKPGNAYKNFRGRSRTYQTNKSENKSIQSEVQTPSAPPMEPSEPSTSHQAGQSQQQNSQQRNSQYQGYGVRVISLTNAEENVGKGYSILSLCNRDTPESSQRTIKLFRTYFYGNEKKAIGYALGDSAAEVTLVKQDLINDLGIIGEPCNIELSWTDSSVKITSAIKVNLKISGILPNSEVLELNECYAVKDLQLPPRSLNVEKLKKQFPYLRNIPFDSYCNATPCILIGSRDAHMFEAVEPVRQNGSGKPVGLKSKLGYTIYGGAPECHQHESRALQSISTIQADAVMSNEQLDHNFAYACSIESLGIKQKESHLTKDEQEAIECLEKEMKILPDGTVELPLVWKKVNGKIPSLPNNYPMVLKRTLAQENKLKKNPELLEAYNSKFKQLIDDGYVRAATETDMKSTWPNVSYIPVSLVVNANKQPIKTRLVYDASARYQNNSLNDNLLMGPNLLVDMLKPLMRMRMNKIAFTGDVKSMFHRIRISLRDQQCQRILWREFFDEPLQVFIQQVMLFGPNSSPFCSQFVKNKTADKFAETYPEAAHALKSYTYMDDLLSSEATVEKAIEVASQCIRILKSINWELIGFQSNSNKFLSALPHTHVKQELIPIMSEEESTYTTKVLGLVWNPKTDSFAFQLDKNLLIKSVRDCGHRPTKRDQCSTIARIFDVIGFLAPCIIRGRILLQRSWRNKVDWDEEIGDEENELWIKWLKDLEQVTRLQIPRLRFKYSNLSEVDSLELHTFCDAGKEAFATSSYFVATINSYRYISFVMAKAKVAPIKMKSKTEVSEMPRLEMMSCLIAARLRNTIVNLHEELKFETFMWTDSEIALRWIKNPNHKLPKFAISPVEEILELTSPDEWRHVDTKNNVADIATKFRSFDFGDFYSTWFQGPKFLKSTREYWPAQKIDFQCPNINVNMMKENHTIQLPFQLPKINCILASDYIIDLLPASYLSNWTKLIRVISRSLKIYYEIIIPQFKNRKWMNSESWEKLKQEVDLENPSAIDNERALLFIIRRMQRESYADDYKRLLEGKSVRSNELAQLNVFLDQEKVMRISSRVNLSKLVYAQKHAPVVPRKNPLSEILLMHYHYQYKHVCIESQVAEFRATLWMPQIRSALKSIKGLCNYCNVMKAIPIPPKMAALPDYRVNPTLNPFEVTGLDCAGPLIIYNYGRQKKVWILIFTCTMSRFVHLHLLNSLDTLSVLEAIMSLWTAHGPVSRFISDNGTNFTGAARVINHDKEEIFKILQQSKREWEKEYTEKYCSWKFIPVQSPWFGGFYERLIKEVKRSILSTIENRKVSRIELNIALQEAAHRINCRPLTHNPISSEDEEVLTPHHLAKFRSGWPLLPSTFGLKTPHDPLDDRNQYRKGRILAEDITRRFVAYYLPILTKRDKWFKDNPPMKVGDLVLLVDPNKTRKAWERAKVIKIYKSKDNRGRVADIKMSDGSIKLRRSVNRLAKLNLQNLSA